MPRADRPEAGGRAQAQGRDAMDDFLNRIGRVQLLTSDEERTLASHVREGQTARVALDDGELEPPARRRLERAVAAGDRARRHFIEANLRLVVSIARNYRTPGVDLADLVQEGNVGLLRAVERFDPAFGVRFSTYATYWIRQAVRQGLSKLGHAIAVPDEKRAMLVEARRAEERLAQQLGRTPADEDVANEMGLSLDALLQLRMAEPRVVSANTPVGESGEHELLELLSPSEPLGDDEVDRAAVSVSLEHAMANLRPRDREILRLRFGFATGRVETLEEVAKRYDITRERVRQLELQAVSALRRGPSAAALLETIRDA